MHSMIIDVERWEHRNLDGTITQNISVDANHRLIDGYHIGLFGKALQDIINTL